MELEVICSYDHNPQEFYTIPVNISAFTSKERLSRVILSHIPEEQQLDLYKVSCCLKLDNGEQEIEIPAWYLNSNGKLWYDQGELTDID